MTFYPASPIAIRDGTTSRLAALGIFKNVFQGRSRPTKDDQLPLAAVWHAGERTQANGDPNAGAPEFIHTLALTIDILARAGSESALDTDVIQLVETARAALLSDLTWIGLFEGIERCDTRYKYPEQTDDFLVQATIEIEVTFRSIWQPLTPNDFKQVAVAAIPARQVTCRLCHSTNVGTAHQCRVCSGPLDHAEPVFALFDVSGECP